MKKSAAQPIELFRNGMLTERNTAETAQSKILPWVQISPFAHFAPRESCWGVPSPNPALFR